VNQNSKESHQTLDLDLEKHLAGKASATLGWEAEQRRKHSQLCQAVFSKKKPPTRTPET